MHRIIFFILVCACASAFDGRAFAQSSTKDAAPPEESPETETPGDKDTDSSVDPQADAASREGQNDSEPIEGDTAVGTDSDTDTAVDVGPDEAPVEEKPGPNAPSAPPDGAVAGDVPAPSPKQPSSEADAEWQAEEVSAPVGEWGEPAHDAEADPEKLFKKRFEKGMQEAAVGLATAGYSDYFFLGVSGAYRRYIIDNFALGAEVSYTHIFSDEDYPEELTIMPMAQYVFLLSETVAPYVAVLGGREFEWSSWREADSWFLGGGVGAHVRIAERVSLNVRVLFAHHWYDRTKVYGIDDDFVVEDRFGRRSYECETEGGCEWSETDESVLWGSRFDEEPAPCVVGEDGGLTEAEAEVCQSYPSRVCNSADPNAECAEYINDSGDKKREWIYPVINFGISVAF